VRPRLHAVTVVFLLAGTLLSGCSSAPDSSAQDGKAAAAALHWPALTVHTTAAEPLEASGPIQVTWAPGLFAIWATREADLGRKTVVQGATAYVTIADMGWTQFDVDAGIDANRLSNRLLLWDLPAVLAADGMAVKAVAAGTALNLTADGTIARGLTIHLEVGAVGGTVVWARETAPGGRESPFTFVADGAAFRSSPPSRPTPGWPRT